MTVAKYLRSRQPVSSIASAMRPLLVLICLIFASVFITSLSAEAKDGSGIALPFGEAGKFKMLYGARQCPESVFLNDRLCIVHNGDAKPSGSGKSSARPILIIYDPKNRTFSTPERLGPRATDQKFKVCFSNMGGTTEKLQKPKRSLYTNSLTVSRGRHHDH